MRIGAIPAPLAHRRSGTHAALFVFGFQVAQGSEKSPEGCKTFRAY